MAQEEIAKQVAFLGAGIANIAFTDPSTLEFDADEAQAGTLAEGARALAERMQRSLRSLKRKVAYRSRAMDAPHFAGAGATRGAVVRGGRARGARRPRARGSSSTSTGASPSSASRGSRARCGRRR